MVVNWPSQQHIQSGDGTQPAKVRLASLGKQRRKLPLALLAAALGALSPAVAQQPKVSSEGQAKRRPATTNRPVVQPLSTPGEQTRDFELEAGHGGVLRCTLRVTLEEGNPWNVKTAEYGFDIPGDGREYQFEFGSRAGAKLEPAERGVPGYLQASSRSTRRLKALSASVWLPYLPLS